MEILSKHEQIANKLRNELREGKYPPGERLPTTKALAREFGVSNNVIIRAVRQLSGEGLIEIKPGGGGMHSLAGHGGAAEMPDAAPADFKPVTGSTIFQIGEPKTIQIHFEDNMPFQIKFWEELVRVFRFAHPDINPVPYFGQKASGQNPDVTIGGLNYLGHFLVPPSPPDHEKEMLLWELPDYSMSFLDPDILAASRFPELLPVMFQQPVILCHATENVPGDAADVSDFIRRIRALSGKPAKYRIWNFGRLMSNCGINIFDWVESNPDAVENTRIMATLKMLRNFYAAGDLLWFHGDMSDPETIVGNSFNCGVRFLEVYSPLFGGIRLEAGIRQIPYPFSRYSDPIPICALVAPNTPYPAEAIDFVRYLLSDAVQRQMLESKIGLPLNADILRRNGYENLVAKLQHSEIINTNAASPEQVEIYRRLFSWEMYHYLNGRRGEDVLDRLRAKIKHYRMVVGKNQKNDSETNRAARVLNPKQDTGHKMLAL